MREYDGNEVGETIGDDLQVRCGLGQNSATFDHDYNISSAGK